MRGVPNCRDNRGFASDHGLRSIFHVGARLPLLSQPQAFIKLLPAVIKTQAFQLGFRPMACAPSRTLILKFGKCLVKVLETLTSSGAASEANIS